MLGKVEAGGFVLGRDAQTDDFVDDEEQNQGADYGDSPGNNDAGGLVEQLCPVAVNGAGGEGIACGAFEDGVDDAGGKEAGEQSADGSTGAVHAKGVKGIVITEAAFDLKDHKAAEDAGDEADEEGGEGLDEAGGRGDGDQASDRTGDGSEGGWLAVVNPLGDSPAYGGGGGGEVGVDEGGGGQRAGGQGAAGVEAEPAYPQQACADEAEDHGVGREGGVGIADAFAEVDAGNKSGDTAGDVDDGAAGEVQTRNEVAGGVEQAADAPDHVGHGAVDEQGPEGEEERHGAELHAFSESAGDERRGDDGEHKLVDHKGLLGNGSGIVGVGGESDAAEEEVLEAADEGVAVTEGQRVSADGPDDGDQSHHGKALHHGAEDVLFAHQAAIEERQSGTGHEQHQGGGDQHPCVVAGGLGILDGLQDGGDLSLGYGGLGGRARRSLRQSWETQAGK